MEDAVANRTERQVDPATEVRFAVVMYGGVSLAIYINGVAHELLDMVRATAPRSAAEDETKSLVAEQELSGAMAVYRRLGQYVAESDRVELLKARPKPESGASDEEKENWNTWKLASIRTRFIVDVISGTSAGGINGIFLAKALANNQLLDGLKQLWVSEGDMARLLNDEASVEDMRQYGLRLNERRESLLNSQRMYRKLLEALDAMEPANTAAPAQVSPLVSELDLFVTTTDIDGLPLPIRLSDEFVYERRHRNIFHFRYAEPCPKEKDKKTEQSEEENAEQPEEYNDFLKPNDPFLAYAARCTSSFPFAFEPMRLCDIDAVTGTYSLDHDYQKATRQVGKWDRFFSEYLRRSVAEIRDELRAQSGRNGNGEGKKDQHDLEVLRTELREQFRTRSFGDGGYLDNKPFSHATSMLMRRGGAVPVERKLVYIEPAPEHPELLPPAREKPDFLENVLAALDLPRQETIREDLERLFERNRLIDRIGALAKDVDRDLADVVEDRVTKYQELKEKFDKAKESDDNCEKIRGIWLDELIRIYGVSYGAYHRLKIDEITSMLSDRISRAAGYDQNSAEGSAIRTIIEAWRNENFAPRKAEGKRTEILFLRNFDIRYCLRRLAFTTRRINEICRLDENAKELLSSALGCIKRKINGEDPAAIDNVFTQLAKPEWKKAFRDELSAIKRDKVSCKILTNRKLEERLHQAEALRGLIEKLDLGWETLKANVIDCMSADRAAWVKQLVSQEPSKTVFEEIENFIRTAFKGAGGDRIAQDEDKDFEDPAVVARRVIAHFRETFQLYDLVTYPVLYGSGAGEANVVQVSRISPEDAVVLDSDRATPRQKLAGTALMNFGAFLQRSWRRNDILWGRLDGAERLICAVFTPQNKEEKEVRRDLIIEAQTAILSEELNPADRETVCKLISEFVARVEPRRPDERALRELITTALGNESTLPAHIQAIMQSSLKEPKQLWDFYNKSFEVDRRLDAEVAVRLIARATDIVGRMLQQLAQAKKLEGGARIAGRVAMLGRIFWRAVEVAVPQTLPHLFFQHWIAVIYVFDFVFIVGGILFGQPEVKNFGWLLLALTFGANVIVAALSDYITGRVAAFRFLRGVVALLLIALLTGGVLFFAGRLAVVNDAQQLVLAAATAGLLGLSVAFAEWKTALRRLPRSAAAGVDERSLGWLLAALLVLGVALSLIGPPGVSAVELAGNAEKVGQLLMPFPNWQWRAQFLVDFGFLIAYSTFLATVCYGASRLWQGRANEERIAREKLAEKKRADATAAQRDGTKTAAVKISEVAAVPWNATERWLGRAARVSLLIAFLQWIAGACDAVENWALLNFLDDRFAVLSPRIARYAAISKFVLIIAGCACGAIGFAFAQGKIDLKARPALCVLGLLLLIAAVGCARALLGGG